MKENKILFVDDEEFLLSGIERQLRNKFLVETCTCAVEALNKLKGSPFSVVVADYHMPAMNGVEFLAKAREITPRTVRILFTGKADLRVAIDAAISARRILDSFSDSIEIDTKKCKVVVSIGISLFPTDATSVEKLITYADRVMYRSKKQGGLQFSFFSENPKE